MDNSVKRKEVPVPYIYLGPTIIGDAGHFRHGGLFRYLPKKLDKDLAVFFIPIARAGQVKKELKDNKSQHFRSFQAALKKLKEKKIIK